MELFVIFIFGVAVGVGFGYKLFRSRYLGRTEKIDDSAIWTATNLGVDDEASKRV